MYSIQRNGRNNMEFGIVVTERPSIPAAVFRTNEIETAERTLIEKLDGVEPITITVSFGFCTDPDQWNNVFRNARMWLMDETDTKLVFSDDIDWFYNVLKTEIAESKRTIRKFGKFDVDFLCDGYVYRADGENKYKIENLPQNKWLESHPEYILTGSGSATLTVNGNQMQATVNGTLTINTDLMIAYNQEGVLQNTLLSGNYEDLYLRRGENEISVSGAELEIIPHWRSL